jgi:hypothetical protein
MLQDMMEILLEIQPKCLGFTRLTETSIMQTIGQEKGIPVVFHCLDVKKKHSTIGTFEFNTRRLFNTNKVTEFPGRGHCQFIKTIPAIQKIPSPKPTSRSLRQAAHQYDKTTVD